MHRLASAALVLGALTASGVALAQRPARQLQYTRGRGAELCPTEEAIRGRILAHLGYDAFAGGPGKAAAEQVMVTIEQRDARLVARIERRDPNGTPGGKRELAAATGDCGDLSSAAAFAVAFALDPLNAHEAAAEPLHTAEPPSLPPAAPRAAPQETPIAPPALSAPLRLRLGVAALGALGSEPSMTGGVSALVGVAWRRWSLDLEGRGDLSATEDAGDGASVRANVLAGSLVPCVAFGVLRGCVIGSVGTLRGSSSGIARAAQADSLWAAAGLRGGVEVSASATVKLRAFAEPVAVLTRTALVVDDRVVWTTPPLACVLALGVVVELH